VGDAAGALSAVACERRPVGQRWAGGASRDGLAWRGKKLAHRRARLLPLWREKQRLLLLEVEEGSRAASQSSGNRVSTEKEANFKKKEKEANFSQLKNNTSLNLMAYPYTKASFCDCIPCHNCKHKEELTMK
jgi:hypothetical protein